MDLYFHFPEAFDEERKIINSFKEIVMSAKKNSEYKIYYSESNLNDYKNLNQESGIYLTDDIKVIRQFLSSQKAFKVEKKINNSTIYNKWNLTKFEVQSCEDSIALISERLYSDSNYKYILLNLENGIETCRNKILVFRDCKHLDYPDYFVKIDYVINHTELIEWLKTNHVKDFSLKDESKFQKKPSINVKGATAYLEIATRRYWHLDTFHKYIEYEVYDSDGIHIATANENGEINVEGKENGRKITIS